MNVPFRPVRVIRPERTPGEKIVIIIGGGFAGLEAAKVFAHQPGIRALLIDARNYHLFQPLLYQVATAGLHPADIAVPIRSQFDTATNINVHMGRVQRVNLNRNSLQADDIELIYDYLIIACGSQHSYFGHDEWEEFAPGLKSVEQAVEIRRRILTAFELAENELDFEKQRSYLNFVIVGGGPTGVELAGAIADLAKTVLVHDFRRIHPESARIILIESGDKVLGTFGDELPQKARRDLEKLGVEVRTQCRVTGIDADGVDTTAGRIQSHCVFWAAGVKAAPLDFSEAIERDRAGRIKVESDLSIPKFANAFVVGDMAAVETPQKTPVPGLAPAAIQEGRRAAENILRLMGGEKTAPFIYRDKGQMATIGKHKAIALIGSWKISGYLAWVAWLFIHVLYLVGFKNRIGVLFDWTWNYLFTKRGSRLITTSRWQLREPQEPPIESRSFGP